MDDRPLEDRAPLVPELPLPEIESPISAGAGFGIRALARVIDLVCSIGLSFSLGAATGIVFAILSHLGHITPDWPDLISQNSIATYGLGIVGGFLYHTAAEGVGGATIGKLICGLRVVQIDGRPATMKGAFIRDLAYYIDALFFGIIGYLSMEKSRLRQRHGDVWGGTVVVKTKAFQSTPSRGVGRITLGILLGSFLWGLMIVLSLFLQVLA